MVVTDERHGAADDMRSQIHGWVEFRSEAYKLHSKVGPTFENIHKQTCWVPFNWNMSRLNTMQSSLVFVCLGSDDVDHCYTCCSRHARGHNFKVESNTISRFSVLWSSDGAWCPWCMVAAGVWAGGKFECWCLQHCSTLQQLNQRVAPLHSILGGTENVKYSKTQKNEIDMKMNR